MPQTLPAGRKVRCKQKGQQRKSNTNGKKIMGKPQSFLERFRNFISERGLFSSPDYALLGVSGGIDSVVMCELFHRSGFRFAIAHCNFQLRGKESDDDEKYVGNLAKKYKVPFFSKRFNTRDYAAKNGISIQMAARDLRYEWFGEIIRRRKTEGGRKKNIKSKTPPATPYSFIAVGTNRNDEVETSLINFTRGTGIAGLHGISPAKGKIIRPLLFATRKEIVDFAARAKLSWREDRSNLSEDYVRNKIRLKIIPVLKEINPNLEQTIAGNIEKIRDAEEIFRSAVEEKKKLLFVFEKDGIKIPIKKLVSLSPLKTFLFEFLNPFGFNETIVLEIIAGLKNQPGKKFYSATHRIVIEREHLNIHKNKVETGKDETNTVLVKKNTKEIFEPLHVKFTLATKENFSLVKDENTACLDFEKLDFPLIIRPWADGDQFVPFGMNGRKKISDFLTDKKVPYSEKEETFVLTSGEKIAWVVGHRIDQRFKVTEETKRIFIGTCFRDGY